MKIFLYIGVIGISSLLTSTALGAGSYAEHNATRDLVTTLQEVEAAGNWPSFISGFMINHPNYEDSDEATTDLLENYQLVSCPANGKMIMAGVEGGSVGTYSEMDCRLGENIVFLHGKPVLSLFCGNLISSADFEAPKREPLPAVIPVVVADSEAKEEKRSSSEVCNTYNDSDTLVQSPYVDYDTNSFIAYGAYGNYAAIIGSQYMGQKRTLVMGSTNCNHKTAYIKNGDRNETE